MKIILWILRVAVGLLFIFSGLVKANDPLGLTYKMNEFFRYGYDLYDRLRARIFDLLQHFSYFRSCKCIVGNYFRCM